MTGKSNDEPEAVLEVVKFGFTNEPLPIEIGVAPNDPRQRLTEPPFEITHLQRRKEQCRGVIRTARFEMHKAGISESCQAFDETLGVFADSCWDNR